jgi:hypothetical protein
VPRKEATRGAMDDLYIVLMQRNCIPHRFLTVRTLFANLLRISFHRGQTMLDLIFLASGTGLFALSIGYAYACDRL